MKDLKFVRVIYRKEAYRKGICESDIRTDFKEVDVDVMN